GESLTYPTGAPHGPYGVATSPDGTNVYATDYGNDRLIVFSRDTTTGNISFVENKINGSGGVADLDGPYLVTVSPDGQNVYVAGSVSDSIVSFKRAPDGTLTFLKSVKRGDPYGFCLPPNPCQTLQGLDGAYGIALSS